MKISFFTRLKFVFVFLCVFPAITFASPLYDVQALQGLRLNEYVVPNAINDYGAIAGGSRTDPTLPTAVLWNSTAISLGVPSDVFFSEAWGINNSQTVVGSLHYPTHDERELRAFIWNGGILTDLNDLFFGSEWMLGTADDINNRGHIVADGHILRNGVASKLQPLIDDPGSAWAFPIVINDLDQVIGTSGSRDTLPIATLWNNGGHPLSLGTFGGSRSQANGINNFGQVVGYAHDTTEVHRAFIWQNGVMSRLPEPLGAIDSRAEAINDAGQIVGIITLAGRVSTPVLWQDGVVYNLNDLITDNSFRLVSPFEINNAGQIVGVAVKNNATTGFLLNPKTSFNIELIDPSPDLLFNGQIISDPERLATEGRRVDGAVADGVTKVLLRFSKLPGPGNVSISIYDERNLQSNGIGKLNSVGGSENSYSITVPVVTLSGGEYVAFVILSVPDSFIRSFADNESSARPVKIRAGFISEDISDNRSVVKALTLYRPPVMLIHGLWSSSNTWGWALQNDPRFIVHTQDYNSTNAASFTVNISEARAGVARAIAKMRDQGIAVTQADVFGHSMGGLLTRLYIASPAYLTNENLGQGSVNSLITVDTPHQGSPLANALISLAQTPVVGPIFSDAMLQLDKCVDCGAVSDLQTDSPAISTLPAVNLPVHAMVGKGGSDLIQAGLEASMPPPLSNIWETAQFFGVAPQDIFPPQLQHDLIVGRLSQEGGLLTDGTQTSVFGYVPGVSFGLHATVTNETATSNRANDLVNTPVADGVTYASGFPAASGSAATFNIAAVARSAQITPTAQSSLSFGTVISGLVITQPQPNTVVTAGQSLTVTVEPTDGFVPVRVLIVTDFLAKRVEQAPFSLTFQVPPDLTGAFTISAYAFDSVGNLAVAPKIPVQVLVPATLTGISVEPKKLYLYSYDLKEQLRVSGIYADDIQRDVRSTALGTTYTVSDTSIATVDGEGVVSGLAPGKTTIKVMNGQHSSNVEVEVVSVVQPDIIPPVTLASVTPAANANGWNNSTVTVLFDATDTEMGGTGVKEINVTLSGAQAGTSVMPGSSASVAVFAEGETTVTYFAVDNAGNVETAKTFTLKIDKTSPLITGMPASGCTLWPPNHKLVEVANVNAIDSLSGLFTFKVDATSNEPSKGKKPDIVITGSGLQTRVVQLRAERLGSGKGRVYTITASTDDIAGNTAAAAATCVVPRKHKRHRK